MAEVEEQPPFESAVHLRTPEPDAAAKEKINELRAKLVAKKEEASMQYADWADDEQLQRFLIARNYDVSKAYDMISTAMKWRQKRVPPKGIESVPGWEERMSKESETGKIYIPGEDKWGRPVVVFDNSVQNTRDVNAHQTILAWNLEYAIKLMPANRDKYCIFMHLANFSMFNNPTFASTQETIYMLCNAYPERLGHCVAYMAPSLFSVVFAGVKYLMDPKTVAKVHIITGDVSDGSPNDLKLRSIIGDNWKVMCGAEQPVLEPKCTPGFRHSQYWPMAMDRLRPLLSKVLYAFINKYLYRGVRA
jgi:hypothetical protein